MFSSRLLIALVFTLLPAAIIPLIRSGQSSGPATVLIILGGLIPVTMAVMELSSGNPFSVGMWYTLIYITEYFGLLTLATVAHPRVATVDAATLDTAAIIYFSSYLLFFIGYYSLSYATRATGSLLRHSRYSSEFWRCSTNEGTNSDLKMRSSFRKSYEAHTIQAQALGKTAQVAHRLLTMESGKLIVCCSLLLSLSLVQYVLKILAAGGLYAYIEQAYQYRFGTYAEDDQTNALALLAGNMAATAFPLLGAGLMLSWRFGATPATRRGLRVLVVAVLALATLSFSRTVFIFSVISLVGLYSVAGKLRATSFVSYGCLTAVLLTAYQWLHFYMYYLTAGWDYQAFSETLAGLLAPHGHILTLAKLLPCCEQQMLLGGSGLWESLFFFVPRAVWPEKLSFYGTIPIQAWAGLPTHYQIAPTLAGELLAHWGPLGLPAAAVIGAIHGIFESLRRSGGIFMQSAVYCIVLPRLLAHAGMGINALAITLFQLFLLMGISRLFAIRTLTIRT